MSGARYSGQQLNATASARQIVDTVTEVLEQFRGDEVPEDDITLVVIKVDR